jgi:biopolymer transport protein ExbB/TolQ
MMSFFREMGFYFWPLTLIAIAVVGLALSAAARLRQAGPEESANVEHTINAVLFWGCVAAVVGILGQFHGIYQALKVISMAQAVAPPIIWGGLAVSFSSTLAGLAILLVAALLWAALRGGLHRRERQLRAA